MYDTVEVKNTNQSTEGDVDKVMQQAFTAFSLYKKVSPEAKAFFLETMAKEIEKRRPRLVATAHTETHLPEARLNGELTRTTGQLQLFATLLREGSWVEAAIDTADPTRTPAKPDIRKMLVPAGPVVVFGASNFPFAFSTAGGDTASALASSSTVVIRGHTAHSNTSLLVFEAIETAIELSNMPACTVQHVATAGNAVGKELVVHRHTTGVGFTGSFSGGKALVEYASKREVPIPVFAEMSSINPVVFYPDALAKNGEELATTYAASITLGAGQFCTNPGLLIGLESPAFNRFLAALGKAIAAVAPQRMLHTGIHASYQKGLAQMLEQQGVRLISQSATQAGEGEASPLVASVNGTEFINNPHLAEEVFGPYSLAIICSDTAQLSQVLQQLKGQLTTTIMGTEKDVADFADLIALQQSLAGRIILNQPPTGVEVCASMVHGGPYPATTDARFTSVGTMAIKRWVRPVALQNFLPAMLPDALKNENPLGIMRLINGNYTRESL